MHEPAITPGEINQPKGYGFIFPQQDGYEKLTRAARSPNLKLGRVLGSKGNCHDISNITHPVLINLLRTHKNNPASPRDLARSLSWQASAQATTTPPYKKNNVHNFINFLKYTKIFP